MLCGVSVIAKRRSFSSNYTENIVKIESEKGNDRYVLW